MATRKQFTPEWQIIAFFVEDNNYSIHLESLFSVFELTMTRYNLCRALIKLVMSGRLLVRRDTEGYDISFKLNDDFYKMAETALAKFDWDSFGNYWLKDGMND